MTAAIVALLAALVALAVWGTVRRARHGSACCGDHEAAPKKAAVADRNRAHYTKRFTLEIGGMTCANCARRVENALNGLPGVWARVSIGDRKARVRAKGEVDLQALRDAVRDAGYTVMRAEGE